MVPNHLKKRLETLYDTLNKKAYVHPDPVEFLYKYDQIRDREIAGMVASSLAYGRVAQILKSVSSILDTMGSSPYEYLQSASYTSLNRDFKGFRHRFATGDHMAALLWRIKMILSRYGSMNNSFLSKMEKECENLIPAMTRFSHLFRSEKTDVGHLVADPDKKSACKRMNLFLRWMVRADAVDPGGWKDIPMALLLVPLDTHMHRIGTRLGMTHRKSADMQCTLEITAGFRKIVPDDPVKYDFSLTRLGIRNDMAIDSFFNSSSASIHGVETRDTL